MKKGIVFLLLLFIANLIIGDAVEDSLLQLLRATSDRVKKEKIFFELANHSLKNGEFSKSKKYLRLSFEANPNDYENNIAVLIKLAHIAILQHEKNKAFKLLNKVKKLLRKKSTNSLWLDFYNLWAYYYFSNSDLESAVYYFKKCIRYSKLSNDSANYASNLNNLSVCYYYLGKVDSALFYSKKALDLKLKIDSLNYKGIAKAYLNIASYYDILAAYDEAVNYYMTGITYAEKSKDKYTIGALYNNMASTFKHMQNYEKAIYYYKQALTYIYDVHNDRMVATILNNIGTCYIKLGENKKAEKYLEKALSKFEKIGYGTGISAAYENLGELFFNVGKLVLARRFFTKALMYSQEYNDYEGVISSTFSLAKVDFEEKKYKDALGKLNDALEKSKQNKNHTYLLDIYIYLARTYAAIGNLKESSKFYEYYIGMKDSVFSKEKEEIANKLEIQYQTKLKEKEINNLRQANAFKELKLKKTKERNLFIEIFLLGIVAFVILLIRKNKIKFENKIVEFKQKLLRSQMNPHFIFNALSTIQGYLIKKECNLASTALQKFASLMRQIIENSREEYVSLREELETVKNYLEIQKMRKGSFDYEIIIDENLDIDEIEVPPMLLQPFIENSIKHAFPDSNKENKITVKIEKKGDSLVYLVMDNGIGYDKSKEMKEKEKSAHKSYAIGITEERLRLLYRNKKKIRFEISDLQKIDRNLHGTMVKFYLPLN